jgi:hypothetical protein
MPPARRRIRILRNTMLSLLRRFGGPSPALMYAVSTVCLTIASLEVANAQRGPDQGKPVVYNEITDDSGAFDRVAKKAYAGKFRFVDIKASNEFVPGRQKGASIYPSDPRPMREMARPAKAVIAFVVTAQGRPADLRIIKSTDSRVADYLLEQISRRWYVPARLRGVPVASLWSDEVEFAGGNERDSNYFKDGLGIQGYRDR